jgi:demethylmenaquinone methyltransferase / 2-methoxy-6-polyprenyl-1,4-benzoquinol methylase
LAIFSGLAESYDRVLDAATFYQDRRWKGWVARRMPRGGTGPVLDVGCGTLVFEGRAVGNGQRFVGIDLSSCMIRRGGAKKLPNVELLASADAERLPFPDSTFDCALSFYVAKYADLTCFAEEIARVTRPGGVVLVYDFANPRGGASPLVKLYIQAGLPVLGRLLRLARRPEADTFVKLPGIIRSTRWDESIAAAMEAHGVRGVETARLTGGAVFAYRGVKEGPSLSGASAGGIHH